MKDLIDSSSLILMEAAIVERLRRSQSVVLHENLVNAPLIYDPISRKAMTAIYQEYMQVAIQSDLPLLVCSPTWRAGKDRVLKSGVKQTINEDAVAFMREITLHPDIKIGGMIGCKNDCYLPDEGLSASDAERFHSWQIEKLVSGGIDFLIAETLPNIYEALGIAKAMAKTERPYIISFVIGRDGHVLDGSTLESAIQLIDDSTDNAPIGYMLNCAHPSFLQPDKLSPPILPRLIGFQGNASSLDHCDLEKSEVLKSDSISEWGDLMLHLNRKYGIKILGGCCGTSLAHLNYLISHHKA